MCGTGGTQQPGRRLFLVAASGQELQFVQKFANGMSLMNMSPRPSGWMFQIGCCGNPPYASGLAVLLLLMQQQLLLLHLA